MIVTVCSDSTGVTSLALTLGMVWPGERLLLEADPSGGDAVFWLRHADGQPLRAEPTVLTLAADARAELSADVLASYAQPTALGVPVVAGAPSVAGYAPVERLWPRVATAASGWRGTVIADLGRLIAHHAAVPVLRASRVVLLLARADVAGLYRLRERVGEMPALLADPTAATNPLAVVVSGPPRSQREAVGQVRRLLDAVGSPVPVAGFVPDDPTAVRALRSGAPSPRLRRSGLVHAARRLTETILTDWPEVAAVAAGVDVAHSPAAPDRSAPPSWVAPAAGWGTR